MFYRDYALRDNMRSPIMLDMSPWPRSLLCFRKLFISVLSFKTLCLLMSSEAACIFPFLDKAPTTASKVTSDHLFRALEKPWLMRLGLCGSSIDRYENLPLLLKGAPKSTVALPPRPAPAGALADQDPGARGRSSEFRTLLQSRDSPPTRWDLLLDPFPRS